MLKIQTGFLLFVPALLPQTYPDTEEIRNLSNRRYLEETLRAIQSAKESIFLVMYHFPLDPSNKSSPVTRLADALIEAKRRGVTLQVILDQEIRADRSSQGAPMKNLRAYHFFKENGISVSFDSLSKRTHAKLLVIDREVVILGSANWSREALDENYEANLWVRSPEMAQEILEEFKAIEGLQPERVPVTQGSLRIARSFLADKNQGSRLIEGDAQRALRLYLLLLSKRNAGTSEKRYFVVRQTLGLGLRELARQDLVEIYYGRAIDFSKREFETASYVLLPPYDPKLRDEKLRELEGLYGKHAFEEAREYARAFFKERDPVR